MSGCENDVTWRKGSGVGGRETEMTSLGKRGAGVRRGWKGDGNDVTWPKEAGSERQGRGRTEMTSLGQKGPGVGGRVDGGWK